MGWQKITEFETVSSADAILLPVHVPNQSVKLPVDDWLCRKMDKLNLTITEGYPTRNNDTSGLLKDQFIKPPKPSGWYGMHAERGDSDGKTVGGLGCESKGSHHTERGLHPSLPVQTKLIQVTNCDKKLSKPRQANLLEALCQLVN